MDIDIDSFLFSKILNITDELGTTRFTARQLLKGFLVRRYGSGCLDAMGLGLDELFPEVDLDDEIDILDALPKVWKVENVGAPEDGYQTEGMRDSDEPANPVTSFDTIPTMSVIRRKNKGYVTRLPMALLKSSSNQGLELFGRFDPQLRMASTLGALTADANHSYMYTFYDYNGNIIIQRKKPVSYATASRELRENIFEIDNNNNDNTFQFFGGEEGIEEWTSEQIRMDGGATLDLTGFNNKYEKIVDIRGANAGSIADYLGVLQYWTVTGFHSFLRVILWLFLRGITASASFWFIEEGGFIWLMANMGAGVLSTIGLSALNATRGVMFLSWGAVALLTRFGYNAYRTPSSAPQPYFDFITKSGLLKDVGAASVITAGLGIGDVRSDVQIQCVEASLCMAQSVALVAHYANLYRRETGGVLNGHSATMGAFHLACKGDTKQAEQIFLAAQQETKTVNGYKKAATVAVFMLSWGCILYKKGQPKIYNDLVQTVFDTLASTAGVGFSTFLTLIKIQNIYQQLPKITSASSLGNLFVIFLNCAFFGVTVLAEKNVGAAGISWVREYNNKTLPLEFNYYLDALEGLKDLKGLNETLNETEHTDNREFSVVDINNSATRFYYGILQVRMWAVGTQERRNYIFASQAARWDKYLNTSCTARRLANVVDAFESNSIWESFRYIFGGSIYNLRLDDTQSVLTTLGIYDLLQARSGISDETLKKLICRKTQYFNVTDGEEHKQASQVIKLLDEISNRVGAKNLNFEIFMQRFEPTNITGTITHDDFLESEIGKSFARVSEAVKKKCGSDRLYCAYDDIIEVLYSLVGDPEDSRSDLKNIAGQIDDVGKEALEKMFLSTALGICNTPPMPL